MGRESERMRQMKDNFMRFHEQGYSIPQIAEMHELSFSAAYRVLQDIADANNVSRDSLLQVIRVYPTDRVLREERKKVRIDVEQMKDSFNDARKAIDFLIGKIGETVKEETENGYYDC